jgi:hypothetical protein
MKILFTPFCMGVLMSALCTGFVSCDSKPQPVRVSAIEFTENDLTLEIGEKQTITANVFPADAENKAVSWKSSDENIAEVSPSGEVTPIAAGTATITATAADGEKTASCTVTVTAGEEAEQKEEQKDPEQEEVIGIQPVPMSEISDEIVAFFDEYANLIANFIPIYENKPDRISGSCILFNSMKELPVANGYDEIPLQYPTIDFDTYTLIIGQYLAYNGGIYLYRQAVVTEPEAIIMNIQLKLFDGGHDDAIQLKSFWGLYSKLPQKPISVNILKK